MKTRIIWTKIWDDKWFDSLSRDARDLFIYLIANQDIGLSGCYYITDKKICYHTHLTQEELDNAKKELPPKILFCEDWVYVTNATGYNGFTGSSNEIAFNREIELIPQNIKDTLLKGKEYTPPTPCIQSINHNHNNKSEIRNQKSYKLEGNTFKEL